MYIQIFVNKMSTQSIENLILKKYLIAFQGKMGIPTITVKAKWEKPKIIALFVYILNDHN